jgi:hypothetical protein
MLIELLKHKIKLKELSLKPFLQENNLKYLGLEMQKLKEKE